MTSTPSKAVHLPLAPGRFSGEQQKTDAYQKGPRPEEKPLAGKEPIRGFLTIPDLEQPQPLFSFTTSSNVDVSFTLEEIEKIQRMTWSASNVANELITLGRLEWGHPLHTEPGRNLLKEVLYDDEPREYPTFLILKEDDETREGTPILRWRKKFHISDPKTHNRQDGWELGFIEGSSPTIFNVSLGFARWDRPDAIANLIQQMYDRESLMVISAMTNAEATSALAAKETARTLLEQKGNIRVETKPVKDLLARHRLTSSENDPRYERGRLRVLAIRLNNVGMLPIAIGILTPRAPGTREEKEEFQRLTRNDYRIIRDVGETYFAQWRARWDRTFRRALPQLRGWRIVELPQPTTLKKGWEHVTWITPYPEEMWSNLVKAAEKEAAQTQMGVGGVF